METSPQSVHGNSVHLSPFPSLNASSQRTTASRSRAHSASPTQHASRWLARQSERVKHKLTPSERTKKEYEEPRIAFKEGALVFTMFCIGWVDASTGGLIPSIRAYYDVSFIVVSLLFICNLAGCIIGTVICPFITDRLGMGKALSIFAVIGVIQPSILLATPPFPLFALAFVFNGISVACQDSLCNTFGSNRPRAHLRLAAGHAIYGVGAAIAPLAASFFTGAFKASSAETSIAMRAAAAGTIDGALVQSGVKFSHFYAVSLGLAFCNTAAISAAFRFQREANEIEDMQLQDGNSTARADTPAERGALSGTLTVRHTAAEGSEDIELEVLDREPRRRSSFEVDLDKEGATTPVAESATPSPTQRHPQSAPEPFYPTTGAKFRAVLQKPATHIIAVFTLLYVGAEVSIGGWTSSFLIATRDEVKVSNYLVSGFWAGLALGRVILVPVTGWLGEQLATFVYLCLSIGLQLIIWLVPSLVANGVSLALMGCLLGPLYPILVNVASRKIRPRALKTTFLSYISSFGASGSALVPFFVGLAAEARGIAILAPILLGLLSAQVAIWALLGKPNKAEERNFDN